MENGQLRSGCGFIQKESATVAFSRQEDKHTSITEAVEYSGFMSMPIPIHYSTTRMDPVVYFRSVPFLLAL